MLLSSVENILEHHTPKNEEENAHFKTLHYEAARINGELIQLLTLYRKDRGFLPVSVDEHYVIDIFEEQIARNFPLLQTTNIQMKLVCEEDLVWYFDGDLIGGVIHNILVNAIRYTKTKIHIDAREENEFLCITIADDGDGFPEDMLLEPGRRVQEAELSRGSTHLGLYFSEEIARVHKQDEKQGYISLENGGILGGGEFKLYIP
jgi:signal transduction histidine kinase